MELIGQKIQAFPPPGGRLDPDLQPLLQELVDQLLAESEGVFSNLQLKPEDVAHAELLSINSSLVVEYARVRGLRAHVVEDMRSFVRIFEASSLQPLPKPPPLPANADSDRNRAFHLFFFYLSFVFIPRPSYQGHTLNAASLLRGMALDLFRRVVLLGTHVGQLAIIRREFEELRKALEEKA